MPKEFSYRGHSLESLSAMSMDEFINMLPSRQRRSLQRGLTAEQRILLEKLRTAKEARQPRNQNPRTRLNHPPRNGRSKNQRTQRQRIRSPRYKARNDRPLPRRVRHN